MATFEEIRAIKRAAQGWLMAIPGVHAVGIGSKIVGGQRTAEPAIMIFLEKKRPLSEIPPNERIPTEIEGIKTDVYESDVPRNTADEEKRRPLVGGSQITPGGLVPEQVTPAAGGLPPRTTPSQGLGGVGTLGCILKWQDATPKIVAVTCQHVIATPPAAVVSQLKASPVMPTVTFSGVNTPGSLVILRPGLTNSADHHAVFYRTLAADTLSTIASTIAARVNALAAPGLSASAAGPVLTLSSPALDSVNCTVFGADVTNTWADVHTTVAGNVISVSGRASSRCAAYVGLNLGGNHASQGVFVPIADGASETVVATSMVPYITALKLPGVVATATAPPAPGKPATVSVSGVQTLQCDVSTDVRVGQPTNEFCSKCSKCCSDLIGVVIDARLDVDAALIQLAPAFVDKYRAEIQDLGIVRGTHDVRKEPSGYPLKTRGATTGAIRRGTLLAVDLDGDVGDSAHGDLYHRYYKGGFSISPGSFSAHGDSGAAVLTDHAPNSDSEVVGIIFAGSATQALATPIQQIVEAFSRFNLSVETATAPGQDKGVPSLAPLVAGELDAQRLTANDRDLPGPVLEKLNRVERDMAESPAGRRFRDLVQKHFSEVEKLVNQNRRVATVWHRNGGPRLVRSVLRMPEVVEETLPLEIDGVPLPECLARIQSAFARYGSPRLAADLDAFGPTVVQMTGLTYSEVLDTLKNMPVD